MRRIPELDGLRGIAALAIVILHIFLMPRGQALWLGHAVDLFFVLSGFLITSILLDVSLDGTSLKAFYARRVLRIWPLYYFGVIACLLLNWTIAKGHRLQTSDWPYYATFMQSVPFYFREVKGFPSSFHHSWTLAIEEQFYLVWPLLVMAAGKRRIPMLAGGLVLLAFCTRAVRITEFILPGRCDMLALGAILAVGFREGFRNRPGMTLGLGVFAAVIGVLVTIRYVLAAFGLNPFGRDWGGIEISARFSAVGLICMGIVGLTVQWSGGRATAFLRSRLLVKLGVISYGIYLLHPLVVMGTRIFLWSWFRVATVTTWERSFVLLASIGAAALTWRLIEEPALRLKDRFPYSTRDRQPRISGWRVDVPEADGQRRPAAADAEPIGGGPSGRELAAISGP